MLEDTENVKIYMIHFVFFNLDLNYNMEQSI